MSRTTASSSLFASILICSFLIMTATAFAADWVNEGMAEPGKWTTGFRLGPSFITQDSALNTAGPLLSFQGLYGMNRWFRVGGMLEWENHGFDRTSRSLDTVTLLPVMLEYRPGHFGPVIPYVSTGIGVNINSDHVQDSFAWRTAGGIDYALRNWFAKAPEGLMLNTEVAWKRNHTDIGDLSAISMLFGLRYTFQ